MSRAIKHTELISAEIELSLPEKIKSLLPVIAPIALAIFFIVARAYTGLGAFLNEGALTLLALVAWMAYAGFLHTRIAHGWRGRRSAYFALLGFAFVIFTWLGVSYLLPGLHSYA